MPSERVRRSAEDAAALRAAQRRQGSARVVVGRSVGWLDSSPAPSRACLFRGIGAVHGGRRQASRAGPGGSAGGLGIGRQEPRLLRVVRRGRCRRNGGIVRDWLRRRGGGTYGFLLFGSPQRCSPIRAAQSNWGLLLTRSASRVRSRSPCSSRLRVRILPAQQKPKDVSQQRLAPRHPQNAKGVPPELLWSLTVR
jgi:hypothetical protein